MYWCRSAAARSRASSSGPLKVPSQTAFVTPSRFSTRTPFLPDEVVDLALWVADYYLASPGDALASAAPPFAWVESEPHYELTDEGHGLLDGLAGGDPLLRALSRGRRTLRSLIGKAANRKAVEAALRGFERKGLVRRAHALPARTGGFRTGWLASLTPAGASAAEALTAGQPLPALGDRQQATLTLLAASAVAAAPGVAARAGKRPWHAPTARDPRPRSSRGAAARS